jgi:DnaJ-class molecular chaperone
MAAAVIVLASLLKEFIQGFTANAVKVFRRLFLWRQNGSGDKEKCPFEVLGLKGGKENSTMEEAVKARRKLALKWHPDRNLGNEAGKCKRSMILSTRLRRSS